jgi:molybdopterin molybdotransferase
MGEFDFVPGIMRELGAEILFDRVAMAPGKPTTFATAGGQLLFGLPGNPVSSMVAFELFTRPALRRLAGHAEVSRPTARARLSTDFRKRASRRMYLRGRLVAGPGGELLVTPAATQSSGAFRSMAQANVLAIIEAEVERVAAGTELLCLLLDHPETAQLPRAGQSPETP